MRRCNIDGCKKNSKHIEAWINNALVAMIYLCEAHNEQSLKSQEMFARKRADGKKN